LSEATAPAAPEKKEEKKSSLFKGGGTNPFAKRPGPTTTAPTTNPKAEATTPKDANAGTMKSADIQEEISQYSNAFIEDNYDQDFF
jgi:hypothetical protein